MEASERVVEQLNKLLTLELTVINQYFAHTKMCENWGYRGLAKRFRDIALEEMKDAEEIMERVLFLEGIPNMQRLGPVKLGEDVPEQLRLQLEGERQALKVLAEGVAISLEVGDPASREFFAGRLPEEEGHVDWLETQISIIEQVGEQNYLAQQISE
jgi:bacterioferritin